MKGFLTLCILALLGNCLLISPAVAQDEESSGGGDLLFNKFVRGLELARVVFKTVRPEWLHEASPTIAEFYREYREELLDELELSPMDLRIENPNGKCAETGLARGSTIFLSKTQCGDIASYTQISIAEILIGEVTHHFGKDNKFAAMTAIALTDAFKAKEKYALPSILFYGPFVGSWDDSGQQSAIQKFEDLGKVWQQEVKATFGDQVTKTSCTASSLFRDLMSKYVVVSKVLSLT